MSVYPNNTDNIIMSTVPPTAAAMIMAVRDLEREGFDSGSSAVTVVCGDGFMIIGEDGGRIVRMSSLVVGSHFRWEMENMARS